MKSSKIGMVLGVCLASGVAATGVAVASSPGSDGAVQSTPLKLGVLNRPATTDAGTNPYATALGRTLAAQRGDAVDPSTARPVNVGGVTVWIAKTHSGAICEASIDGKAGEQSTSCADQENVAKYGLFSATVGAPGSDQTITTVGVVPDGVSAVRLQLTGAADVEAKVTDNVTVIRHRKRADGVTLYESDGATRRVSFGGGER